jgi:hypothetical protein
LARRYRAAEAVKGGEGNIGGREFFFAFIA